MLRITIFLWIICDYYYYFKQWHALKYTLKNSLFTWAFPRQTWKGIPAAWWSPASNSFEDRAISTWGRRDRNGNGLVLRSPRYPRTKFPRSCPKLGVSIPRQMWHKARDTSSSTICQMRIPSTSVGWWTKQLATSRSIGIGSRTTIDEFPGSNYDGPSSKSHSCSAKIPRLVDPGARDFEGSVC